MVLVACLRLVRTLPLVAFGVMFFYATHIVESGFIPIRDLAFEHRNYLLYLGYFSVLGRLL